MATNALQISPLAPQKSPRTPQLIPRGLSSKVCPQISFYSITLKLTLIALGNVYDVTEFISEHPGGSKILLKACGKDSTELFWRFHSKKILTKTAKPYLIGPAQETSKL